MVKSRFRKLVVLTVLCMCVSAAFAGGSRALLKGKEYTNSFGMKFVRIEPGAFQMGESNTLAHEITHHRGTQFTGDFDEHPVHKVIITKPFYMGVCEVKNFQYELFRRDHKKLRGKEGLSKDDDEAVIFVNWYEAQAFCRWLADKEGLPYRLPTEAEWEYACRAGTTTAYQTGELLPKEFHKNARMLGGPVPAPLHVGQTTRNRWGLYDMHGNVEEWCLDWYGPYVHGLQIDPVGYTNGDFRVLRGGSHATEVYYLRSANRLGTVPEDKHWLIGFRVVIGEMPKTAPLPAPPAPLNQQNVIQRDITLVCKGPDPDKPHFERPRKYVTIPASANGPLFAGHNHCPAIVECPNGDLLTIWYTGIGERERNMAIAASRLRYGEEEWEPASPFWDPPDRNDTALSMWYDDRNTIYHFNSLSISSNWNRMAAVMRTSNDSGATWSKARLILPEHDGSHQLSEAVIRMQDGSIAITHDAGATLWVSGDEGLTWYNPGGSISGNHPSVAQLEDGRLFGLGRGGDIDGYMPRSISIDGGKNFTYSPTELHPIGGGQRLALLRLREGPLFVASFGNKYGISTVPITITDSEGGQYQAKELFGAVSLDGGKTWPYKRVIGQSPAIPIECTDGGAMIMSDSSSEYRGYLSVCQGLDGVIHLISSRQHYAFNLKWIMTPPPAPAPPVRVKHEVETFTGPRFDLDYWFDYKSYTGGFNGKGKYTVRSIMPYGGISRAVGEGSFEATFVIDNMRFHPGLRWREMAFGFKDNLTRTIFLHVGKNNLSLYVKDTEAKHEGGKYGGLVQKYLEVPKKLKMRFIWLEENRQIRIFYGLNGAEATTELPQSEKGIYLTSPFSQSNAAYFLMSEATADIDYFEIRPL